VLVEHVDFRIKISATMHTPPEGYLFICAPEDFGTGPTSFRWPNSPAYWSLDPSGSELLRSEEATLMGFPSVELTTKVWTKSWDASVYAGLRQFHQAKGFDPDGLEVARFLEQPLYQLSTEMEVQGVAQ
jgi:hypothetical protein